MSKAPEGVSEEEFGAVLNKLKKMMDDLYLYRDLFFEQNPVEMAPERTRLVEERMNELIVQFDDIEENQIPTTSQRANYLFLKGRTYNVNIKYDCRASHCLSKAVKLNPRLVDAWNELGECYWKNLNIKDAKHSFEGALKNERNKVSLRSLSIVLRQEVTSTPGGNTQVVQQSVDYAKEAVSLDLKDGVSWCVLGNAYLCQYFMVAQDPSTLRLCLSAYRQADVDPVARGQPDLHYNRGVALKYDEQYEEALKNFERACKLDPSWTVAAEEMRKLLTYVTQVNELVRTMGKLKAKKLRQLIQSIDPKQLFDHMSTCASNAIASSEVNLDPCPVDELVLGENPGRLMLGRVVGSIHSEHVVPFTFALVEESGVCVCVTVYNWAEGRGVIIGDSVAVPAPRLMHHRFKVAGGDFDFKSIRVNNPMILLVNGKRVGREQFAGTRVTSTYEIAH